MSGAMKGLDEGPAAGEGGVEVPAVDLVDLELPRDVGLRGAELPGVAQQAAYGVRRAQLDERGVGAAGLGAVPRAQAHGQLAADDRLDSRGQARRHGGGAHATSAGRVKVSWLTSR
jgi:hypothetical protein